MKWKRRRSGDPLISSTLIDSVPLIMIVYCPAGQSDLPCMRIYESPCSCSSDQFLPQPKVAAADKLLRIKVCSLLIPCDLLRS